MERVPTGIDGLDTVLGGGVKRGSVTLVEGTPGTGKTTVGLQFIHTGLVTYGEPGLIVTFEQLPDQLYEDAAGFGWDLRALERENRLRVLCMSPQAFIDDFRAAGGRFDLATVQLSPRRALIDSITVLHLVVNDEREFRGVFYALMNHLKLKGLTSILVRELQEDLTGGGTMEEFLGDAVLRLSYEETTTHTATRFLRVVKSRGYAHQPGRHPFRFGPQGLELFPTPRPLPLGEERKTRLEKVATGVPGLDDLLDHGLVRGMSTLLVGSAGTGKTTLGLQFLNEGAEVGERGLLINLEECCHKLRLLAEAYNFDVAAKIDAGLITLLCVSPVALCVEELFARIHRTLQETAAQRIVVDGLSSLTGRIDDPVYRSDYVYSLVQMFARFGATSILTVEMDHVGAAPTCRPFGQAEFDNIGNGRCAVPSLAAAVDNIILLHHVESGGQIRHGLSVLKARASAHAWDVREYILTGRGVEVLRRVLGPSGPLSGAPLLTREARGVARDFTFSDAEYEDVLTLVQDRMQRIIATSLPPQGYATAEEFYAAHDRGETSLAQLEGISRRVGPDGTVFVLPECPFVRGLGSLVDNQRYQKVFDQIVASFRQENPEVEIAYPFCIAHFQARARAAQETTLAGQPIQTHQLAIRTGDPQRPLLNRVASRELGLTDEEIIRLLGGGFCCYVVRLPEPSDK
jgi:circadian clock protein KaiC